VDPQNRGDRGRLAVALARLEVEKGWGPAVIVDRQLARPLAHAKMLLRVLEWRARQDLDAPAEFIDDVVDHRAQRLDSARRFGAVLRSADLTTTERLECISAERDFVDDLDAFAAACEAAGLHEATAATP
jgi:hypothetical protein